MLINICFRISQFNFIIMFFFPFESVYMIWVKGLLEFLSAKVVYGSKLNELGAFVNYFFWLIGKTNKNQ